jgi:hypothetical protein
MTERERVRTTDSASTPTQRNVYAEPVVDTSSVPMTDGTTREIYQEQVSTPAIEPVVYAEPARVPSAATRRGGIARVKQIIYFIFGAINVLLVMRFVLLLLGASEDSAFVSMIYGLSHAFVLPFSGIFAEPNLGSSVFEWAALVGIIVYSLIAYGIARSVELIYSPVRRRS